MENKNKEKKLNKVQKRSTYSEMKNSDDKTKTFVIMLKNNPELLNYFEDKNLFTRTPEWLRMVFLTEQYARKEHLRSPLYSLVEKYRGDEKFKYASAEKEIKKLIQDSIAFIKNTNSVEYNSVLKVLENIDKKEIDTSKIYNDKEWYRQLIKTLGAMGLGAALMAKAFWAVPETKPEPIVQVVENQVEVQVGDESCPSSLEMCLNSLEECKTRKPIVKKMECNEDEICKLYKDEIEELRKMLKEGEAGLLAKIDGLEKQLKDASKDTIKLEKLRLELLKKLDNIFATLDSDGYNTLYPKYRNIWAERLKKNEKAAYLALIVEVGNQLLVTKVVNDVVIEARGHGQRFSDGSTANFDKGYDKGTILYLGGNWKGNNHPGTTKAAIDVTEKIYDIFVEKYGKGSWTGKIE